MIVFIIFLCISFYSVAMENLNLAQVSSKQQMDLFERIQSEASKSEDSVEILNTISTILKSTKTYTLRDLKNIEAFEKHVLNVLSSIKIFCESADLANFDYDRCLFTKYLKNRLKKNAQKFFIDRISEDHTLALEKITNTSLQIFTCIILEKIKAHGPRWPREEESRLVFAFAYARWISYWAAVLIIGHFLISFLELHGVPRLAAIGCVYLCHSLSHTFLARKEVDVIRAKDARKLKLRKEAEEKIKEKAANNKCDKVKSALLLTARDQSPKTDSPIIFRSPHLSSEADPQWCLVINGECMDTLLTASMLDHIEQLTKRPIYELFDYVFASSMASLLALGLTASLDGEKPLVSITQLIDLLQAAASTFTPTDTPAIRQKKIYQMLPLLTYRAKLSHSLTKVFVPYVEQKMNSLGQSTRCYFDRSLAQINAKQDVLVEEAIKSSIGDNTFIAAMVNSERNIQKRASSKYKNDAAAFLVEMNLFSDDLPNRFFIVVLSTGIVNDNNSATHDVLAKKLGLGFKTINPTIRPQNVTDCSPSVLASYKKAGEEAIKDSIDFIRLLVANYERKKSLASQE